MQLANEVHKELADEMIAFYKSNFAYVGVVYCNKCETPIAMALAGPKTGDWMTLVPNDAGLAIVQVAQNLASSRARLDKTASGLVMMGFECNVDVDNPEYPKARQAHEQALKNYEADYESYCEQAMEAGEQVPEHDPPRMTVPEKVKCGNNTLLAEPEVGVVPVGLTPADYSNPFEKHHIAERIRNDKTYTPDFKEHGPIRRFETFRIERQ